MASYTAYCGTCVEVDEGNVAWTGAGNCTAQDGTYAESDATQGPRNPLRATNFGFSVPSDETVTGFSFRVRCFASESDHFLVEVHLIIGGVRGTGAVQNEELPTSPGDVTVGGSSELFGESGAPTYSQVNASNFGVDIWLDDDLSLGSDITSVDAIEGTVYTTGGFSPSDVLNFGDESNPGARRVRKRIKFV